MSPRIPENFHLFTIRDFAAWALFNVDNPRPDIEKYVYYLESLKLNFDNPWELKKWASV